MPTVNVIAKKDFPPLFKIGDALKVVPILYEVDTLIRRELHGIFKGEKFIKIYELSDHPSEGCKVVKISDDLYAPKGSYKDSYIELSDGRQYSGSYFRRYEDYFTKV